MPAAGFEFDGLRASATSPRPEDLVWLEEFLCPQFARTGHADAMCTVRMVYDPERLAALQTSPRSATARELDCFALDQQVVRLPTWQEPDGTLCIVDAKFDVAYLFDAAASRVDIVAAARRPRSRVPAMRVLREFAMNHSLAAGHLFIHGSAVALGDAGIVVAGPTTSGKTTLLVHLLSLGGTTYVSNDRVLVQLTTQGPRCRGMPAITTLRSSTLDFHPTLRQALLTSPFNHRATIAESIEQARPIQPWEDGRFGLTPAQFCRLMGVDAQATAQARAVLLPKKTNRNGTMVLRRLSPAESERRLQAAIFGIGCWTRASNLFAVPDDRAVTPAHELRRRVRLLVSDIPVFECELGLQAYGDPTATRARLEDLLSATQPSSRRE